MTMSRGARGFPHFFGSKQMHSAAAGLSYRISDDKAAYMSAASLLYTTVNLNRAK